MVTQLYDYGTSHTYNQCGLLFKDSKDGVLPLQTEKNIVLMFIFKLTKPFQHYPGLFFLTRVASYYDLKKNVVGIIGKKKKICVRQLVLEYLVFLWSYFLAPSPWESKRLKCIKFWRRFIQPFLVSCILFFSIYLPSDAYNRKVIIHYNAIVKQYCSLLRIIDLGF